MINWAYFDTKVSGNMKYVLKSGVMIFSLTEPTVKMSAVHTQEYQTKYPNKHKFPTGRLEKGMLSQLQNRSYRFAMPSLNLESLGLKDSLQTKSVTEQGENLVFSFMSVRGN